MAFFLQLLIESNFSSHSLHLRSNAAAAAAATASERAEKELENELDVGGGDDDWKVTTLRHIFSSGPL